MEIGTGLALAGCSFALVMLVYRVLPPKSTKAEDHKDDRAQAHELREVAEHDREFRCPDHSGVIVGIEAIKESSARHEDWLKDISRDVKAIRANGGK